MDDAAYLAEIAADRRRRMPGVYICVVIALLLSLGVWYSMPMMHGEGNYTPVDARIVAVARNKDSGKLEMTSEFTDARGQVHRETEHEGYHYAPGDPQVGQSVEYLYRYSEFDGSLQAFPRGDRILQWVFGAPALFLLLLAAALVAWLQRKHNRRRWLLRHGRREAGQMHAIAHRSLTIPVGAAANTPIDMWRIEARYFDAEQGGFVDCHSEWMPAPAPELKPDSVFPPVFLDPERPGKYWLPAVISRSGS